MLGGDEGWGGMGGCMAATMAKVCERIKNKRFGFSRVWAAGGHARVPGVSRLAPAGPGPGRASAAFGPANHFSYATEVYSLA